jgi:hypothetical protein
MLSTIPSRKKKRALSSSSCRTPSPFIPLYLCAALSLVMAVVFFAQPARAQKNSEQQLRNLHGVVEDKGETPVGTAVVYLKNVRTLTVKTFISEDNGQYHFSGLDPEADYEVHAESADMTSATHTVSSFDSRKDFEVTLKLDKKKSK